MPQLFSPIDILPASLILMRTNEAKYLALMFTFLFMEAVLPFCFFL